VNRVLEKEAVRRRCTNVGLIQAPKGLEKPLDEG